MFSNFYVLTVAPTHLPTSFVSISLPSVTNILHNSIYTMLCYTMLYIYYILCYTILCNLILCLIYNLFFLLEGKLHKEKRSQPRPQHPGQLLVHGQWMLQGNLNKLGQTPYALCWPKSALGWLAWNSSPPWLFSHSSGPLLGCAPPF